MKRRHIAVVWFVFGCCHPAWWAAGDIAVPLAGNAAESKALLARAEQSGKVFVRDLRAKEKGAMLQGSSERVLPPGRYRLHVPLAMAPLGDIVVGGVAVTVRAGDERRTVLPLQLSASDVFEDFGLDFASRGGAKAPVAVEWEIPNAAARAKRTGAARPVAVAGPEAALDHAGDDSASALLGLLAGEDAPVTSAEAQRIPYRLLARPPHIERLSPVAAESVRTDRITYKPGQRGSVAVVVRNYGDAPTTALVLFDLVSGLASTTRLYSATLPLAPNGVKIWEGSFDTGNLYWGAEVLATVACDGFEPVRRRAVFGVATNFWELAIMATHLSMGLGSAPAMTAEQAQAAAEKTAAEGFTGFEAFFWAPCDMIDYTPDEGVFFACQGGHRYTISGTRNLIAAAHQVGMAATVYANLWGAGGMPGMDLMRRHPDWFGQAEFATYYVDDWPLLKAGKLSGPGVWIHNQVNTETGDVVFQRHIEETIAGHRQFGWDGTRYDSYYSAEWTKRVTARVRAAVEKAIPGYQWGYNSIESADEQWKAIDIMVGGGGLIMEEGLAGIVQGGGALGRYAETIAKYRDSIWAHRGHFGLIYRTGEGEDKRLRADELYLSSILLAGGAHPYYNRLESLVGEHPLFALRYSESLWNNRMRPLKDPKSVISIAGNERFLMWPQFARTLNLSGRRHRLIVHLINADSEYRVAANLAGSIPHRVLDLPITIKLPADARVEQVSLLRAVPEAAHSPIAFQEEGERVSVQVPEVRIWSVVVVDYEANQGVEAAKADL